MSGLYTKEELTNKINKGTIRLQGIRKEYVKLGVQGEVGLSMIDNRIKAGKKAIKEGEIEALELAFEKINQIVE